LVEHRVDDVNKGLIAGKEAVPAGEQVSFEPSLAGVLAEAIGTNTASNVFMVART
jgi:hypothetical protein